MVKHTDKETLLLHVHHYTDPKATIYTDEWRAYEQVVRKHQTVEHGIKEWAVVLPGVRLPTCAAASFPPADRRFGWCRLGAGRPSARGHR